MTIERDIRSRQGIIVYKIYRLKKSGICMNTSSDAFVLIVSILTGVLALTSIGIYFSFGPGAKSLLDPWELDDD